MPWLNYGTEFNRFLIDTFIPRVVIFEYIVKRVPSFNFQIPFLVTKDRFILVNSAFCSISSGPTLFVNDFIYSFSVKRGLQSFINVTKCRKNFQLSELGIL